RVLQEMLDLKTKDLGQHHWQVIDARLNREDLGRRQQLSPKERDQLEEATRLNEQVHQLWSAGRPQEALPLARQVVQTRRRLLGPAHRSYALSLVNLAAQYKALNEYAQAEPLYRQACDVYKQALGDRHPKYALSLDSLASLYHD